MLIKMLIEDSPKNMDLLEKTKELCRLYDIKPTRSKGQNFLINGEVYDRIVEAAEIKKTDTVLEVGPGLGFLTAKLATKTERVVAVELDDKLAAYLKDVVTEGKLDSSVKIINQNILDLDPSSIGLENSNYKIVANLPYNITSVFLRKFLSTENKPTEMILMLQKEVAERICAKPGDMSLLALSVQFYADPEILFNVGRSDFYPSPEVDSAVIQLRITNDKLQISEKNFFRLAKIGFSAKRKMLKNNLANGLHISSKEAEEILTKSGFDSKIRAEDLSVDDWMVLVKNIYS